MASLELDPKLEPLVEKLLARSNDLYDAGFVRDLVAHVASEFDAAPVRDYVSVLITKEASDELRRLDALRPMAS